MFQAQGWYRVGETQAFLQGDRKCKARGMFNDQSRLFSSCVMLGEPTALGLIFLFYKMGIIIRTTLKGLLLG